VPWLASLIAVFVVLALRGRGSSRTRHRLMVGLTALILVVVFLRFPNSA
jgi:predicted nucleic acid-binding Zn ribbon protein